MKRIVASWLFAVLPLWPAAAHHSLAMYDRAQTKQLNGTVKAFHWVNPHIILEIIAPDEQGRSVTWTFEGRGVMAAAERGWSETMMRPGDAIAMTYHPHREGMPSGLLTHEMPAVNGVRSSGTSAAIPTD